MKIPTRVALMAILVVAFAVRVHHLDAQGLWTDEALSFSVAAQAVPGILEYARSPFHHPPLYFFLLAGWIRLAGDSEFAMRFLSLFFSVLIVALIYRFAQRWWTASVARWASVLAALSPFGVVYAQEARMYSLAICVSLVALDYSVRWLAAPRWSRGLVAFSFVLLGLSIHYYSALLVLVIDLYVVWDLWQRRQAPRATLRHIIVPWLTANLLIVLLVGSWLLLSSGPQATVATQLSHPWFEGRNLEELQRNLVFLVLGGIVYRPLTELELLLTSFLLGIVALGALQLWHARPWNVRSPLLWLLVMVPPIASSPVPLNYNARYFFMSVPALIILSAVALHALAVRHRPLLSALVALVLCANAYGIWFNDQVVKNAYRAMAQTVTGQAHADDALILDGPHQDILANYYLRGPWEQRVVPLDGDEADITGVEAPLQALQSAHRRLWVIGQQASAVDPADNVPRWLSLNAYPVSKQWFQYDDFVALFLAERTSEPPSDWNLAFGDLVVLEQAQLAGTRVNAGEGITVHLTWRALKPITHTERFLVSLRLFDAQGHVVVERLAPPCDGYCPIQNWLPGVSQDDRHGLLVPPALSSGVYYLHLAVFQPQRQRALPIRGDEREASLELAQISVVRPAGRTQP